MGQKFMHLVAIMPSLVFSLPLSLFHKLFPSFFNDLLSTEDAILRGSRRKMKGICVYIRINSLALPEIYLILRKIPRFLGWIRII